MQTDVQPEEYDDVDVEKSSEVTGGEWDQHRAAGGVAIQAEFDYS